MTMVSSGITIPSGYCRSLSNRLLNHVRILTRLYCTYRLVWYGII
ncbi:unnamed protein product [Schistosoma curassoni]|uniref:Uncharacterized protein n=1 Tax=Schistosoma curassoni TaxID=6186 RepID=A0A183KBB7_9TREM|nr:unnamed protein product [Schistosoma curassoni]